MTTPYYRPSGRVPSSAYLVAILISAGLIPFAWLYAWLIIHLPLVFKFMITLGFSLVIAELTKLVAARGKVRSAPWISRIGVVFGVAGWYLQWAAWAALTLRASGRQEFAGPITDTFASLATQPWLLFRFAMDIVATGTMRIAGWPLSGGWLVGVWLVELWMHVLVAPMWGRVRAEQPFCETTNEWAEKIVIPRQFFPVDAALTRGLLETDSQELRTVLKAMSTDESVSHAELALYRCAERDAYASITNVHVTVDDKGQVDRKRECVVDYLRFTDDVEALVGDLLAQPLSIPGAGNGNHADAGPRIAPALSAALEHLEAERYAEAVDASDAHVSSDDSALRPDARRICALACSRLGRWQDAARYFELVFEDEPSAHNALQLATSSVMAGALAEGLRLMDAAMALNAESREMPHMALLTGFVTALKQAGHAAEAMPFIEQIRQAYIDVGSTDPTALYLRSMPFFSVFLNNSLHFVRASLEPEQGRRWYVHMLPSLDPDGRSALNEWLDTEFGPITGQA